MQVTGSVASSSSSPDHVSRLAAKPTPAQCHGRLRRLKKIQEVDKEDAVRKEEEKQVSVSPRNQTRTVELVAGCLARPGSSSSLTGPSQVKWV